MPMCLHQPSGCKIERETRGGREGFQSVLLQEWIGGRGSRASTIEAKMVSLNDHKRQNWSRACCGELSVSQRSPLAKVMNTHVDVDSEAENHSCATPGTVGRIDRRLWAGGTLDLSRKSIKASDDHPPDALRLVGLSDHSSACVRLSIMAIKLQSEQLLQR